MRGDLVLVHRVAGRDEGERASERAAELVLPQQLPLVESRQLRRCRHGFTEPTAGPFTLLSGACGGAVAHAQDVLLRSVRLVAGFREGAAHHLDQLGAALGDKEQEP